MAFPEIGKEEPLLAGRSKVYRSLTIHRLSKLVYTIEPDSIHVVAFWDCRREPKSLADEMT